MARRNRSRPGLEKIQDPGKDLFAYLFLLMMVFCLMLLMTMEEHYKEQASYQGPEKSEPASSKSSLARVDKDKLGRLVKKQGRIYISFNSRFYSPEKDLGRLISEGKIIRSNKKGKDKEKILYLREEGNSQILLAEYLSAFQKLNHEGITIAFAKVKQNH